MPPQQRMTFGKYTGTLIRHLPQDYLEWLVRTAVTNLVTAMDQLDMFRGEVLRRESVQ